jgi:hypothetical protein
MLIKEFDELGEVGERAGQAIDLVDHDDVDPPLSDVGQESLQGRAVQGATREAAIVIALGTRAPPSCACDLM